MSEHDLLFGLLALQTGLVSPEYVAAVMASTGQFSASALTGAEGLSERDSRLVNELVDAYLERHGNDVRRALDALSKVRPAQNLFALLSTKVDHPGLQSTLCTLARPAGLPPEVPNAPGEILETLPPRESLEATTAPGGVVAPAGRFRVLRSHARGGLGEVFVAVDEELGREVALKEIQAHHTGHAEAQVRFLREARVTGRLEHPGIVPVYGLGVHPDGRPYYAMRLIRGESLRAGIQRLHEEAGHDPTSFPLQLRRLLRRFVDVCNAVAYAHSVGVLHRDLKPDNVMLGPFGETLVVDWGLAKVQGMVEAPAATPTLSGTADGFVTQGLIGTPAFMSPEQAAGKIDELTAASDIFSLGATLYQLLTGQPPFTARDVVAVLSQVQQGRFPPPRELNPAVPAALEAVCLKAMALRPQDRHPAAQLLGEDIDRWLLGREEARAQALAQVDMLEHANPLAVPLLLRGLQDAAADVLPRLHGLWEDPALPDRRRLRVGLALLPHRPAAVRDRLAAFLLRADDPQEVILARDTLTPWSAGLAGQLWRRLGEAGVGDAERVRLFAVLAAFDPDAPDWGRAGEQVTALLLDANPLDFGVWASAFQPVRHALLAPLAVTFRGDRGSDRGRLAATLLADYGRDRPEVVANLLPEADERQHALLLPQASLRGEEVAPLLHQVLAECASAGATDQEYDQLALRQAGAAVSLLRLGRGEGVWSLLRRRDDPSVRSYLIHHFAAYGVDATEVLRRLDAEPDVSARQALVLALGEYPPERIPSGEREQLISWLLVAYRDEPDPGMHGSIDWLLRRWGLAAEVAAAVNDLRGRPPGSRLWYVNGQGQTFTTLPGPMAFVMGSPVDEPERIENERQHRKVIPRSFALGTRQVTVAEFCRFLEDNPGVRHSYISKYSPDDDGPILSVTWFEAAQYCSWLSQKEGVRPEQWCYPPVEEIKEGMHLPADCLARTGYRLPTEAEWEYACRAGARTARSYGRSEAMLAHYGWYIHNSQDRTWPCGLLKPNDWGLFDMHGNLWETCHDVASYALPGTQAEEVDEDRGGEVRGGVPRVLRGGSFHLLAPVVRCAYRHSNRPEARNLAAGLRVARTVISPVAR